LNKEKIYWNDGQNLLEMEALRLNHECLIKVGDARRECRTCMLKRWVIINLTPSDTAKHCHRLLERTLDVTSREVNESTHERYRRLRLMAERDSCPESRSRPFRERSLRVAVYFKYWMMWCASIIMSGTSPDAIAMVNQRWLG
jgi:hypothetical protein